MDMKKDGKKIALVGFVVGSAVAALGTWHSRMSTAPEHMSPDGSIRELSRGDWKRALIETKNALGSKNLSILAAGVAYYSILAVFPLLAAAVAIAALLITPDQIQHLIGAADAYLPSDVASVITSQLHTLVSRRTDNVLAAAIALVVALYGASGASKSLVVAGNVAYGVKESRGFLRQQVIGIMLTIAGIMFGFLVASLLAVNQTVLREVGVPPGLADVLLYGRWPIILLVTIFGLALFYRYGPNRMRPKWQWVSWGAIIATVVWLIGTALFFLYVQKFGNYTKSYSLFAGIIILMVWINLSALIVLLGAEVNHRLEVVGREKQNQE